VIVRELELDLDAFEGPFDLLLTLVLREELELAEVDVAEIVLAFCERLGERGRLDLDACGEFLVLVAALLELKARGPLPGGGARAVGARAGGGGRGARAAAREYRRIKEAAAWLLERLRAETTATSGSARRRSRRAPSRGSRRRSRSARGALRALATEPPDVSLAHMGSASRRSSQFLERFRALLRRRRASTSSRRSAG
jgi:segregation and condensation protein A